MEAEPCRERYRAPIRSEIKSINIYPFLKTRLENSLHGSNFLGNTGKTPGPQQAQTPTRCDLSLTRVRVRLQAAERPVARGLPEPCPGHGWPRGAAAPSEIPVPAPELGTAALGARCCLGGGHVRKSHATPIMAGLPPR